MEPLPRLLPPRPPQYVSPLNGDLPAEATPRQIIKQLREVFREAFDDLGGASWLVEFASKNDQNARVFVQAISKLLPPANDVKNNKGVIIDVPWLTNTRLSYKRQGDEEITDIQVQKEHASRSEQP